MRVYKKNPDLLMIWLVIGKWTPRYPQKAIRDAGFTIALLALNRNPV